MPRRSRGARLAVREARLITKELRHLGVPAPNHSEDLGVRHHCSRRLHTWLFHSQLRFWDSGPGDT